MQPHYGYRDGEVPVYRPCEHCGLTLRADRLDLLAEHADVCGHPQLELPVELELLARPNRRDKR